MTLLAEPLVVFGPRRGDALATRADALVALKQAVDPKKKKAMHASEISVVASPGGRSAWALDIVSFGTDPLAVLAVLSNADDIWLLNVVAVAQTPTMRTVRAELKHDAVVPPGMAGLAKQDPNAKGAVDKLTRGLAAQQVWGDDLATRTDAVVIGPAAGDITRGKDDIKKMWKKRMKSNVREAAVGETTAQTTGDGQLAWVTAPVVRFEDNDDPLPLRVFAVFEKNGADWKMIALQESLAIDAPGAGAALKKTPAPALPKTDEPAKPATPPAKKTTKKKKKSSSS
jgi:ketosteroid isomerase-like protein